MLVNNNCHKYVQITHIKRYDFNRTNLFYYWHVLVSIMYPIYLHIPIQSVLIRVIYTFLCRRPSWLIANQSFFSRANINSPGRYMFVSFFHIIELDALDSHSFHCHRPMNGLLIANGRDRNLFYARINVCWFEGESYNVGALWVANKLLLHEIPYMVYEYYRISVGSNNYLWKLYVTRHFENNTYFPKILSDKYALRLQSLKET